MPCYSQQPRYARWLLGSYVYSHRFSTSIADSWTGPPAHEYRFRQYRWQFQWVLYTREQYSPEQVQILNRQQCVCVFISLFSTQVGALTNHSSLKIVYLFIAKFATTYVSMVRLICLYFCSIDAEKNTSFVFEWLAFVSRQACGSCT